MSKRPRNQNRRLFDKAPKLVGLDIGCGQFKEKPLFGIPFLGMDIIKHDCVDIVHDIQKIPWPVPSHSVQIVRASHVWEHIEPKYRFDFMDECWRICRPAGQLWIMAPYDGSPLDAAHPAHYKCPNAITFKFFDPAEQLYHSCSYKKPKPWQTVVYSYNMGGCVEFIANPRKTEKGRPVYVKPTAQGHAPIEGI
jgi:hypothetical protein